jgi:hypothetical protein
MGFNGFKQKPNCQHKFKCGHRGKLPKLGVSNKFALWQKDSSKKYRTGGWVCFVCSRKSQHKYRQGLGPSGLIGWAKHLILTWQQRSRKHGYALAKISPEELVVLRQNSTYCADGCGLKLKWNSKIERNPCLHHDHKTGKVFGFIVPRCNLAEGILKKIENSDPNKLIHWIASHFPTVVDAELAK